MLRKNFHCQRNILCSGLPIKYSFNCFLKAGRVLVSRIVAGRLFQVRGPATSKARSPILVLVPGTKISDAFDDHSRDLFQSSHMPNNVVRCCSDIYTPDALAYSKPLGCLMWRSLN